MEEKQMFSHMSDLDLVVMLKDVTDRNFPEDKDFKKDLQKELAKRHKRNQS